MGHKGIIRILRILGKSEVYFTEVNFVAQKNSFLKTSVKFFVLVIVGEI